MILAKLHLSLLILLVMVGDAFAIDPPKHFLQGPYLAPVYVRELSLKNLKKTCAIVSRNQTNGCAIIYRNRCMIYLRQNMQPNWRQGVLEHEQAHCRGWKHK